MMKESVESRKNEKKAGAFDLPVPKSRVVEAEDRDRTGFVPFTMLTRSKQQVGITTSYPYRAWHFLRTVCLLRICVCTKRLS